MKAPFESKRSDARATRGGCPVSGAIIGRNMEQILDQALEDSFPASDPLSSMSAACPFV
ncbi:MAG TPA: hypothetical protein VGH23_00520 [Rhizomicrobium sp.]|jgi:hypothetical protein